MKLDLASLRLLNPLLGALFAALWVTSLPARAQTTFRIDQEGADLGSNGSISTNAGVLAQGFVPLDPYLGGIRIQAGCCDGPASSTVRLDVRQGGPVGPVLAASNEVTIPDGIPVIVDDDIVQGHQFAFFPALNVTPGALHSFELVIVAGGDVGMGTYGDNYPGAARYFNGTPNASGHDFTFVTGRFVPDPKLYWADAALLQVESAEFDGSNRITVAQNGSAGAINGVSVDTINAQVYWIECCGLAGGRIRRANLDSSGATTIPVGGTFGFPERVLVDPVHQYLFWSDSSAVENNIRRANTDGSGTTTLHEEPGRTPSALALDPFGEKVYWTEKAGLEIGIHRMNLDGSNKEPLVTVPLGDEIALPEGLAIHPAERKMYWTDLGRDEIRRANLDGSGIEVIATALSHGLQNPIGIAVDTIAQQVYWTDTTTDKITRADLDGSNPIDFITTGLSFPRALAIVPGGDPPVYAPTLTAPIGTVFALLLAVTGCAALARRKRGDGPDTA